MPKTSRGARLAALLAGLFLYSVGCDESSEPVGTDDTGARDAVEDVGVDASDARDGGPLDTTEEPDAVLGDGIDDGDRGADSELEVVNDLVEEVDAGFDALPDVRGLPVTEAGPYQVAYRTLEVTYRPDREDEDRTLPIGVWYPTRARVGASARYQGLFLQRHVFADAPLAPGSFPLMVFSHGSQGFREQSAFFTEFFASHGWVVAAPDHVGNTTFDQEGGIPPELFIFRPQDVSAVTDLMLSLPGEDPLSGHLTDELVVAGHSFGGYTTLAVAGSGVPAEAILEECAEGTGRDEVCEAAEDEDLLAVATAGFGDERIDLAIAMAPGGAAVLRDGVAEIEIPVLLMTGGLDTFTPNEEEGDPFWDALDGPTDLRLNFPRGGHFTFSDMCKLIPGFIDGECGEAFVDPVEAQHVINTYALAFVRAHLFGDEGQAALLSGETVLSEDVEVLPAAER